MKKVEHDWTEFGDCANAVKKLVRKLGFNPVDPITFKIGMRVRRNSDDKGGVIVALTPNKGYYRVAFDYFTEHPLILKVHRLDMEPNVNRYPVGS